MWDKILIAAMFTKYQISCTRTRTVLVPLYTSTVFCPVQCKQISATCILPLVVSIYYYSLILLFTDFH
ncbi:unnamed protein product, partial [Callosobruchus maculatus]